MRQTRNKRIRRGFLEALQKTYPTLNLTDADIIVVRSLETSYFVNGKEQVTRPVYTGWLVSSCSEQLQ